MLYDAKIHVVNMSLVHGRRQKETEMSSWEIFQNPGNCKI